MAIEDKLKSLPTSAGIYLHKNSSGKIIYVGKAKNLKNRVRSYFQASKSDWKTNQLKKHIADFEFIVVDNEVEALVLESIPVAEERSQIEDLTLELEEAKAAMIAVTDTLIEEKGKRKRAATKKPKKAAAKKSRATKTKKSKR